MVGNQRMHPRRLLDAAQRLAPDVIALDVNLPNVDWLESHHGTEGRFEGPRQRVGAMRLE